MLVEEKIIPESRQVEGSALPRTTLAWVVLVLVALAAMGLGIFAFGRQTLEGFILTGLRNPGYGSAAWGLYIAFDVFFIGTSFAGITVAGICRLFDIGALKPITRIAELLTISALLAGAGVVMADLGRPLKGLERLPRYANPSSPFYGTFTLVMAGYLFSSLVFFFLSGRADAAAVAAEPKVRFRWFYRAWASGYRDLPAQRARHHFVSFWLALTILPLLVTAHSTLGFIFGLQSGRPGWFSALQAPGFVILAGASGTGMLILSGLMLRRLFRLHDRLPDTAFHWLGNFLWVLSLVYLYFTAADELTASYAGPLADREVAHATVWGDFAPVFWTTIGSLFLAFLLPFLLYVLRKRSVTVVALAALFANVAAVCKRFLIVVPSQTHGALAPVEPPGAYQPTWVEYSVIFGLFGLIAAAMMVFGRFFPLVPRPHPHEVAWRDSGLGRRALTGFVALSALGLIVVGLSDSFRLWSHGEFDPRIPYSPVVFAFGVMLLFASAAVYEVLPERGATAPGRWRRRHENKIGSGTAEPAPGDRVTEAINVAGVGRAEIQRLSGLVQSAQDAWQERDPSRTREIVRELKKLVGSMPD